ncbi:HWE histidine kinase domain-containing protein [Niveispirillum sp. KHB5.9]|uniref:HWE histidine kinase domain-containing protein n=1 Tax=Niveispirillum sp. KHB5.9 TaxID=3400269 RepID=UPI003A89C69F
MQDVFEPPASQSGSTPRPANPSRAVVWLALTALLVALALFAAELLLGRARVMERATTDTKAEADQLSEHAARLMGAHALVLRNAEWLVRSQSWDAVSGTPHLFEWLRDLAGEAPEVQSYWLVDATGKVRVSTLRWPVPDLNVADRAYFLPHESGMVGPHVSPRLSGRLNPEVFFALSRRIDGHDGTFMGVVQVSLRPAYFESFYASVSAHPDAEVMLVRDDGEVLVRHPAPVESGSTLGNVADLVSRRDPTTGLLTAASPFDGQERLYAVADVDRVPVRIVYGISTAGLQSDWGWAALGHFSFAILATLLLLPLAVIALRQTRQAEVAQGQLRSSNVALEARVRERTAHLDIALDDLRLSEERLSRLVNTAPVAIMEIGPEGRYTDVNAAAERILGLSRAAIIGVRHDAALWQATSLDGRPLSSVDFPTARALAGEEVRDGEYALRDPKTGARQILSVNAVPIRDENGRIIGCTATAMDVTGRYEAEDRQRLLMREVDHRAKNALAVAQAVVRLSRADSIEAFTSAVEGRVSSLARSHSLLAQASWSGADLERLVEDEVQAFAVNPGQLTLRGPRVRLGADMVQSLGLVFHELATNAAKHGALSRPEGMVTLDWTVRRGTLDLTWTETGGPEVVAPPTRQGFGSTLLGQVLRHQLGGKIDMDWAPAGLRCHITLPLGSQA